MGSLCPRKSTDDTNNATSDINRKELIKKRIKELINNFHKSFVENFENSVDDYLTLVSLKINMYLSSCLDAVSDPDDKALTLYDLDQMTYFLDELEEYSKCNIKTEDRFNKITSRYDALITKVKSLNGKMIAPANTEIVV